MTDFKTPLPIHRAAFARIGKTLNLPAAGMEELRKCFQAGERRGAPSLEVEQQCAWVLGNHVWDWPWLYTSAGDFERLGIWPKEWAERGIARPFDWQRVPNNGRVWLVVQSLFSAVYAHQRVAEFDHPDMVAGRPAAWYLRLVAEPSCPASVAMVDRHADAIARGDRTLLPPFFPGDPSHLRLGDTRRR